jgi:hypothetical protein
MRARRVTLGAADGLDNAAKIVVPGKVEAIEHIAVFQHPELDSYDVQVVETVIAGHERVGDDSDGEADLRGRGKQRRQRCRGVYLQTAFGLQVRRRR